MSGLVILSLKKYVLNKPETIVLTLSEAVFVIVIEKSSEASKKSVGSKQEERCRGSPLWLPVRATCFSIAIPIPTANTERRKIDRKSGSVSGFGVEMESVGSLQLAVGKKRGVGAHLCVCPC